MAGIGVATALIVAGPYFVDSWRVYGDPLYTFNVHGNIYSIREGEGEWEGSTAEYVAREIAERPIAAVDTIAQGVTTHPFANRWQGLDRWWRGLGHWASVAAILGLIVLAPGPHPVYYSRTVTTSFQYAVSRATIDGPNDEDRVEYLRAMSPGTGLNPFRAHTVETVAWSTADALSQRVRELRALVAAWIAAKG